MIEKTILNQFFSNINRYIAYISIQLFQTYIPNQNCKATIPSIAAMEHAPNVHATRRLMLTSAYEGDMFRSLASVVSYVHLLWELVLLSEPIVVMASSPTTCSELVQALIA